MNADLSQKEALIARIERLPAEVRRRIEGLSAAQLKAHTLPGEWSVQQLVHHLADSHMNSYCRLKMVLTMSDPVLQGYPQEVWATLPDVELPVEHSLKLLEGLHTRWVEILRTVPDDAWARTGQHTENGTVSAWDMLLAYADHCNAHLEQIDRTLKARALR